MNQLILGDCLEKMKDIPDGSIDMILTDPPYGINLQPQRLTGKFKNTVIKNDDDLKWVDEFSNECFRLTKNICYIFCSYQKYDIFKQSLEKAGFIIKNCLVWDKMWFGMGNNWRPNHEFILLVVKTNFQTKSNNLENILRFRRISSQKSVHPTEKPIPLLELLINESSNENNLILDPFAGSGTTAVACINTKRNYICIEKDEKYFEVMKNRIDEHQKQQRII